MIIGGLSENLLLTILQRIEELYREVVGGRAEGSNASRLVKNRESVYEFFFQYCHHLNFTFS